MREIKFRAFDKEIGGYLDVDNIIGSTYGDYVWFDDSCIIEQYTGLHDKNGVEIWEGDIIALVHAAGGVAAMGIIVFDEKKAQFRINPIEQKYRRNGWDLRRPLRVIGNVHKNQELLQ